LPTNDLSLSVDFFSEVAACCGIGGCSLVVSPADPAFSAGFVGAQAARVCRAADRQSAGPFNTRERLEPPVRVRVGSPWSGRLVNRDRRSAPACAERPRETDFGRLVRGAVCLRTVLAAGSVRRGSSSCGAASTRPAGCRGVDLV